MQDTKKQETLAFLNDFLNSSLGLQIKVDDFFTIGIVNPKPVILMLQTVDDKRAVMERKSMLKGFKTLEGQAVYLNDYFPPAANEKRKREFELTQALRATGNIEAKSYVRGAFAVNGEIYKKKITPPTPKDMIDITPEEVDTILKYKTVRGAPFSKQESSFVGYSATIECIEDVSIVYRKIRMLQPEARHVVCAYMLQNQDYPIQYSKDYQDDGEYGAGRILLDVLEAKNMDKTVIFVARKYGGIKMGADRFTMYAYAAKSALGIESTVEIPSTRRTLNRTSAGRYARGGNQNMYRGRGGGRPYGRRTLTQNSTHPNTKNVFGYQQHLPTSHHATPQPRIPQTLVNQTANPQYGYQSNLHPNQQIRQPNLQQGHNSVVYPVPQSQNYSAAVRPTMAFHQHHQAVPPINSQLQIPMPSYGAQYPTIQQSLHHTHFAVQNTIPKQLITPGKQQMNTQKKVSANTAPMASQEDLSTQSGIDQESQSDMDFKFSDPDLAEGLREEWADANQGQWDEK